MFFGHDGGGRIIPLGTRRTAGGFPALRAVEDCWEALRAADPAEGIPGRDRLDPRALEGVLSHVFLLERIAPGIGRFRLAGRHLAEAMGMEVRGMPLTALFAAPSREAAGAALEAALAGPARVRLDLAGERGFGRPPLEARMLFLPLRDSEGRLSRVLGACQAAGAVGRTPRRFLLTASRVERLESGPAAAPRSPPAAAGLAEPPAPFAAPPRRGRPVLRVVPGRDG